jgi:hypothetical protein
MIAMRSNLAVFSWSTAMSTRRAAVRIAPHTPTAALKRGAAHTARFVHANLTAPAAAFLVESVEGVVDFAADFADSAREVNKAIERAHVERRATFRR